MRLFSFLTFVVLLFGVIAVDAQDSKTDFSGKWTLNADKSELGSGGRGGRGGGRGGRGMSALKMVVEQKDNKLIVETFRQGRDGNEMSTKVTYNLDGKRGKNDTGRGEMIYVAKWEKERFN